MLFDIICGYLFSIHYCFFYIAYVQFVTVLSRLWHVYICEEIWKILEWEGFLVHRNGIWLLPTQKRVSYICIQLAYLYTCTSIVRVVTKFSSTCRWLIIFASYLREPCMVDVLNISMLVWFFIGLLLTITLNMLQVLGFWLS